MVSEAVRSGSIDAPADEIPTGGPLADWTRPSDSTTPVAVEAAGGGRHGLGCTGPGSCPVTLVDGATKPNGSAIRPDPSSPDSGLGFKHKDLERFAA